MERKLVKQGRNALTVTLPARWLQDKRLEAGDSVTIEETDETLTIKSRYIAATKEITIDAHKFQQTMMYHALIAAYIKGYDRITILNEDFSKVQQSVQRRLLGFVIEEHTPNKIVIKSIIAPSSENTQTLIRRAGHLLQQHAAILLDITEKKATIDDIKRNEDALDSTLFFCMRHLNTYERSSEAYKFFLLCETFEAAGDRIVTIAAHGATSEQARTAHQVISEYNQAIFAGDFQKAYKALRTWRSNAPTKTYVDGLFYALIEILYNNMGYLISAERQNI